MKVFAVDRWGRGDFATGVAPLPHRWLYRGQVVPTNTKVAVEAAITLIDDDNRWLQADGFLQVDGRVIYQMNDFTLRLLPEGR